MHTGSHDSMLPGFFDSMQIEHGFGTINPAWFVCLNSREANGGQHSVRPAEGEDMDEPRKLQKTSNDVHPQNVPEQENNIENTMMDGVANRGRCKGGPCRNPHPGLITERHPCRNPLSTIYCSARIPRKLYGWWGHAKRIEY